MQICKGSLRSILQFINEDGEQGQPLNELLKKATVIRCQLDFVPLLTDGIPPSPAGQLIIHSQCKLLMQTISLQFGYKNTMGKDVQSLVKGK